MNINDKVFTLLRFCIEHYSVPCMVVNGAPIITYLFYYTGYLLCRVVIIVNAYEAINKAKTIQSINKAETIQSFTRLTLY